MNKFWALMCLLLVAIEAQAEVAASAEEPSTQTQTSEKVVEAAPETELSEPAAAPASQPETAEKNEMPSSNTMSPLGTSSLLKKGQWETGVFGPTRIGLTDQLELRLHPLIAVLSPHFTLRFNHGQVAGGDLSVEWGAGVPTYALRMLQGDGAGTFFPTDVEIPWMIVPRAGLIWSKGNAKRVYTVRSDVTLGVAFTQPERSVESPGEGWLDLLFAPATDGYRARLGVTYDRSLAPGLRSRTSLDLYGTGIAANPMMMLGRQVFDVGIGKGRDGRSNRLSLGVAWLNSFSHATGGARSNDFMPVIDVVF